MKLKHYAPKDWWEASEEEKKKNCNGCGSELDISGKLVPDTIYGVSIREDCCKHDWGYAKGSTWSDKLFTDVMFLYNMCVTIINHGGWLQGLRLLRAGKYFMAVVKYGDKSFADGKKEVSEENKITFQGEFR